VTTPAKAAGDRPARGQTRKGTTMNGQADGIRRSCRRWAARLTTVAAAAGVVLAPAGAASAATHSTSHFGGELRTWTSEPCLGGAHIELRLKWSGTLRWTDVDDNGTADQLKLDLRAEVQMKPVDPTIPSYAGRLGAHVAQATNGKRHAQTQVIHSALHGSDNSQLRIRSVIHVTSDENGRVSSHFERPRC
jgi:hypothetical protein